MIYCVCRQINTSKVDEAAACGARTARCVLAHHGERFNCGKCACAISERLQDLKASNAAPAAPSPVLSSVSALAAARV